MNMIRVVCALYPCTPVPLSLSHQCIAVYVHATVYSLFI